MTWVYIWAVCVGAMAAGSVALLVIIVLENQHNIENWMMNYRSMRSSRQQDQAKLREACAEFLKRFNNRRLGK